MTVNIMSDLNKKNNLTVIGALDSHDRLKQILRTYAPCKILDIPAGTGVLSDFLQREGFDVSAGDIDIGNFQLEGKIPFNTVNLNRPLSYSDDSFDMILSANGLHRIFNLGGAIRELGRILKPEGTLIINLNNYANLRYRLRFLIYGSIDNAVNAGLCHQSLDDPEAHVRIPVLLPNVINNLHKSNFEVISISPGAVRRETLFLKPIGWLIKLLALLVPKKSRLRSHLDLTNSESVLNGGRYLTIVAKKK